MATRPSAFFALVLISCGGQVASTEAALQRGDDPSSGTQAPDETSSSAVPPTPPSSNPPSQTPAPDDIDCPGSNAPFVADSTLSDLSDAQSAIVGRWRGTQTNPWTGSYDVVFQFESNGHYSSRSVDKARGPALYYGTDDDTPLKQWRLEDIVANGTATGEIDVAFGYGGGLYQLPTWQGLIDDLAFDVARNRMRFEMRTDDGYGPLLFDLRRCP